MIRVLACVWFLLWLSCDVRSVKLIEVRPIKCIGTVFIDSKPIFTTFISRNKLEILESERKDGENEVILCNIVPIICSNHVGERLIRNELRSSMIDSNKDMNIFAFESFLIQRDGGLYDNLPHRWINESSKKELYKQLTLNTGLADAKTFNIFMKKLDISIKALFIEESDQYSETQVALGASILLSRMNDKEKQLHQIMDSETLSSMSRDIDRASSCIVDCYPEEVITFSIALNMPLRIPENLFDSLAVDGKLSCEEGDQTSMRITYQFKGETSIVSNNQGVAKPAWEIYDPSSFAKWTPIDKRRILRASGVKKLPKPRDGNRELDKVLLDLMDEAVRSEILRIQATSMALDMDMDIDSKSASTRQELLRAMAECLEQGDMDRAKELRQRFASLTALRADPTQTVGSYDPYLDQDDWYMQARKRAMSPRKKP